MFIIIYVYRTKEPCIHAIIKEALRGKKNAEGEDNDEKVRGESESERESAREQERKKVRLLQSYIHSFMHTYQQTATQNTTPIVLGFQYI